MRKLIVLILVLATLWGGYWVVGSRAVEHGLAGWIAARRAEGWAADYAELNTVGFPSRFDTTLTQLRLADPETGLAWTMPFFQILALSYKPNHIIAVWPDRQTLATPEQSIEIAGDKIQGSVVFRPGTDLALERTDIVAQGVALTSSAGWNAALEQGRFAIHRHELAEASYRLGADILALEPSEPMRRALDPLGTLPRRIETLRLDATLDFDRPWDRFAIEDARPQPVRIELDDLRATWGELDLRAAGDLVIGDGGLPEGRITVKATNWREMLALGVSAGLVPQGLAPTIARGLEVLAGLSGSPQTLDAPLSFQKGFVSFGPIPLGPAPRFVLR